MWIVFVVAAALLPAGAWLLFLLACSRDGGPLGRFLPSLLHADGNPVDEYSDAINEGKAWHARQDWEHVSIVSHDGLKLHGVYLAHPQPKRAVLCIHGYHGSAERDFSCAMAEFYALGSSLLLVDRRFFFFLLICMHRRVRLSRTFFFNLVKTRNFSKH